MKGRRERIAELFEKEKVSPFLLESPEEKPKAKMISEEASLTITVTKNHETNLIKISRLNPTALRAII